MNNLNVIKSNDNSVSYLTILLLFFAIKKQKKLSKKCWKTLLINFFIK